ETVCPGRRAPPTRYTCEHGRPRPIPPPDPPAHPLLRRRCPMPVSTADIATPEASRLIRRLCTHWAHRFEVKFDADSGFVPFDPTTTARLRVDGERLHASVEAADAETVERF